MLPVYGMPCRYHCYVRHGQQESLLPHRSQFCGTSDNRFFPPVCEVLPLVLPSLASELEPAQASELERVLALELVPVQVLERVLVLVLVFHHRRK